MVPTRNPRWTPYRRGRGTTAHYHMRSPLPSPRRQLAARRRSRRRRQLRDQQRVRRLEPTTGRSPVPTSHWPTWPYGYAGHSTPGSETSFTRCGATACEQARSNSSSCCCGSCQPSLPRTSEHASRSSANGRLARSLCRGRRIQNCSPRGASPQPGRRVVALTKLAKRNPGRVTPPR